MESLLKAEEITNSEIANDPPITCLASVMRKRKKMMEVVPLLHRMASEPTVGFVVCL